MSNAVKEIAAQAATKPGAPKQDVIETTWNGIANWIEATMKQGKVNFFSLLSFS